jgi:ribosome-associated protein
VTAPREIPLREIRIRASRSSGPGGQNVNKVETRIEAEWNVDASDAFTSSEKARIRAALGRRVTGDGTIRVASQRHRSQARNREAAVERLRALVAGALRPRRSRVETRPTRASKEVRLEEKKRRSAVKRLRGSGSLEDG